MARPSPADTSARSQFGCGCTIYLFVALRLARHAPLRSLAEPNKLSVNPVAAWSAAFAQSSTRSSMPLNAQGAGQPEQFDGVGEHADHVVATLSTGALVVICCSPSVSNGPVPFAIS
jgi:hypothetical protein